MHQQLSQRVNAVLFHMRVNSMSYKLNELNIVQPEDDEPLDCYDVMALLGECRTAVSLDLRAIPITSKCAYTSEQCYACATMDDLCIHDIE